ncbi:MAG: SecDF P1 head subdomain-containing protein, partial [bacterium]
MGDPWAITRAGIGTDEIGRPNVIFGLDNAGAARMGRFTTDNVQQQLSIVLDDEVFNAANIQTTIFGNGSISGTFSREQLDYLVRVLTAGSLEAKVSSDPISINILGPSIGADNLTKGLEATVLSVLITCV